MRTLKQLVYLTPVPLNSPSQRPHHFVEWAYAHLDCPVWWIEPYPARLPRWSDVRRLPFFQRHGHPPLGPTWREAPWLTVRKPRSLPLEPLPGGPQCNAWLQQSLRAELQSLLAQEDTWLVIGRPSALALALCAARAGARVLYDVMDDMPQFSRGLSRRWMRYAHETLLAQAAVVWGSSSRIVEHLQGRTRTPPVLVRNGVTLPPLSDARPLREGVGSAAHAQRPLVLGYVGTIAAWFDWQALAQLALQLPQARVEVYGPVEGALPADLPPNVHMLGPIAHAEVFERMRAWHAGLIPFKHNTLTASVDPVKYYEYRACGLPVLSTLFGEMPQHAARDEGVWAWETLPATGLEQQLRAWHHRLAERHAHGAPLEPAVLQEATWGNRFAVGASQSGW